MRKVIVACIRGYQQWISPWLGRHCRFEPSCSQYALEAVQMHGVFIGGGYAVWRLLRCQPLCKGGYDPVPTRQHKNSEIVP
jgi:putative membrane protein insertion efficiency factor